MNLPLDLYPPISNVYEALAHLHDDDEDIRSEISFCTQKSESLNFMREVPVNYDQNGMANLLSYIFTDMATVNVLVNRNIDLFLPFCRSKDPRHVIKLVDNIMSDITELRTIGYKTCKFGNDCKYKECCAYVHEIEFQMVLKAYRFVQYSANKLIEKSSHHCASGLLRNLSQLELHVWHLASRKRFGRKCLSLLKDKH